MIGGLVAVIGIGMLALPTVILGAGDFHRLLARDEVLRRTILHEARRRGGEYRTG